MTSSSSSHTWLVMAQQTRVPLRSRALSPQTRATLEVDLMNTPAELNQVEIQQDEDGTLQEHTERNLRLFDDAFPELVTDEDSGMLRRPNGRFLFSSHVDRHNYVIPALYRDNCAVLDISFEDLMAKLANYESVFPREAYAEILRGSRNIYRQLFQPVNSETDIFGNLMALFSNIAHAIDRSAIVSFSSQRLSAASGHLAKRLDNTNTVDPNAGVAGKCDLLLSFGHSRYNHAPLCAIEMKLITDFFPEMRWFPRCGAALAQEVQSHVGHGSLLSIALTQYGFKIFLIEPVPREDVTPSDAQAEVEVDGRFIRIYSWPELHQFHVPRFDRVDRGLKVLGEVVRLSTVKLPDLDENIDDNSPKTPISNKRSKREDMDPSSGTKTKKSKNAESQTESTTSIVKNNDGTHTVLRRINLRDYYTDEQIEEMCQPDSPIETLGA